MTAYTSMLGKTKPVPTANRRRPYQVHRRNLSGSLLSGGSTMPIAYHSSVPTEPFTGEATIGSLVGDQQGSTPGRVGIQVSPPG
jgi:hypothetical protein